MAINEKDVSRLGSHIKLIYVLIVILFLITTSSFIVNFLYILDISEDLSLKCSCAAGERLLSLDLRVEGYTDDGDDPSPPRTTQTGDAQNRLNEEDSEEDILLDKNMERDRRKFKTSMDDILLQNRVLHGYAKLPLTISVSKF